jgi:hypothetical protein
LTTQYSITVSGSADDIINVLRKLNGDLPPTDDAGAAQSTPADPWDTPWPTDPTTGETPSTTATAPSSTPPPATTGTVTVNAKNGPQQWTLNTANAPVCKHGRPAAYVQGFTNGKPWKRWSCALGAGEQWRDKCDFNQWA